MIDGDLRPLFKKHLPSVDWQPIEIGALGRGVPDMNFCFKGSEGWIENKKTNGWKFRWKPEQIGWSERRMRHGGRFFVAVRRLKPEKGIDQLYFFHGKDFRAVAEYGVTARDPLVLAEGGPEKWDWASVLDHMGSTFTLRSLHRM
jgi:hypothetical protein